MNRAIKFRIYPDKEQEKQLAKTFGCCRFLYNRMQEVDTLALANVQLHLERAYKNFFENRLRVFQNIKQNTEAARAIQPMW